MNKKIIWIAVAVVVVLAIAGAVMISRKDGGQIKSDGTSKGKQVPVTQKQASFKELLGTSSPQKCTFGDPSADNNSSGTVYISNNKMRGDFQATTGGVTVKSHMIVDGNYSYVWLDNSSSGFKMMFDVPKTDGQENTAGMDVNKQNNYSCQPWKEDVGLLTVPTTIKFAEFNPAPVPAISNQAACSACDNLTENSSRLQCRSALQCK